MLANNLEYDFSELWDLLKPLYDKNISIGEIMYISIFAEGAIYTLEEIIKFIMKKLKEGKSIDQILYMLSKIEYCGYELEDF